MSVTTNNFKNGMCIMYDNKMWIIVDFQHVKPGKGGAFVRTKLKELKSGRVVDITFRAGEKLDDVRVETKHMQYLYNDGSAFHFMDTGTYEQIELGADFVGETAKWLKENDEVDLIVAGGDYIGVEPPMFVELEVTETDPGFKGDTVQGGTKPATLETGAVVQLPMFINVGERVKIDTRDGRYITRV
ncbi:MAG: elongation factor P [Actinobacteria bacterium HGW-Actinobacteria-6]|jgi:elongation factor P|nr:MAG: elongation factor P [Actinobacteria bacterium HGW-Actinobacteria-6]